MKESSIEVPGKGRVEYLRLGEGNPRRMILLHGFPETPRSFTGVMNLLVEDGWDLVAPYALGYKDSGQGLFSNQTSLVDLVDWNYSFLRELGWEKFTILGHDWGAIQTYTLCQKYPESVQFYFALSVPPLATFLANLLRNPVQFLRSWYILFFQTGLMIPEKTIQNSDFLRFLWKSWSPNLNEDHPVLEEVRALFQDTDRVRSALSYYRGLFPTIPFWGKWNESRELAFRPILVSGKILAGQEDGCISIDMYEGFESAVKPGTELVILKGAGHFLPLEVPDQIHSEIRRSTKIV